MRDALAGLVAPDAWVIPSLPCCDLQATRQLAQVLSDGGHPVSHMRVSELLHGLGYPLQGNAKVLEGAQHADRDAQFRYINEQVRRYLRRGEPVSRWTPRRRS